MDVGSILTEFGHKQRLLSMLLIPVTGALGAAVHYHREHIFVAKPRTLHLILFGILCSVIYSFHLGVTLLEYLTYPVNEPSRRPPFLILLPVLLSLLVPNRLLGPTIFLSLTMYIYVQAFVIHYLVLFLVARMTFHGVIPRYRNLFSALYIVVNIQIIIFEVERVNILQEFILISGFISIIHVLSVHLSKLINLNFSSVSIIIFYYCQALFFIFSQKLNIEVKVGHLFFAFIICCTFSILIKKIFDGIYKPWSN